MVSDARQGGQVRKGGARVRTRGWRAVGLIDVGAVRRIEEQVVEREVPVEARCRSGGEWEFWKKREVTTEVSQRGTKRGSRPKVDGG